jgi:heavy metal sensor kinase
MQTLLGTFDSVRVRLTLWYVGVLSLILVTFSLAVYIMIERTLYQSLDAELGSTLHLLSNLLASQGDLKPATTIKVFQKLHPTNQAIAIFDPRGNLMAEQVAAGGIHVRLPQSMTGAQRTPLFYSLPEVNSESDDSCRGVVGHVRAPSATTVYTVVVNQSLEPTSDQLDLLQDVLFVTVPSALALAGLGGWFLARRSLQPVVAMSAQARRIGAENLNERLPIANPRDELGTLAAAFNALLARLGHSFSRQRQFMADASHELRTPLSAIRTASAVTLQQEDRSQSEYREALSIVEQESRRLSRIVDDMFVLARADARPSLQMTELFLDRVLAATVRAARSLAIHKNLRLESDVRSPAPYRGDQDLLQQMLWNLLDNAIKYTPSGGAIRVALASADAAYVITVTDTGTGIPADVQPHIFERFYRAQHAHPHADTFRGRGAGLGLPIARWIAEAHRGRLELRHSDETGSIFAVSLPYS